MSRPLLGEPMSLDLLNTLWRGHPGPVDDLDDLDGVHHWLEQNGLDLPATEDVRSALITAREAIREHTHAPDTAREELNRVLAWGRHRTSLEPEGPVTVAEVATPAQLAGWLAAVNYIELLTTDPERIRGCAHPDCDLYFYDTNPKRNRRWCSMTTCGNRAKAARHHARNKP